MRGALVTPGMSREAVSAPPRAVEHMLDALGARSQRWNCTSVGRRSRTRRVVPVSRFQLWNRRGRFGRDVAKRPNATRSSNRTARMLRPFPAALVGGAPSAGFEPAHTPPEGDALSPELRGPTRPRGRTSSERSPSCSARVASGRGGAVNAKTEVGTGPRAPKACRSWKSRVL
jgi:hypothetical protein